MRTAAQAEEATEGDGNLMSVWRAILIGCVVVAVTLGCLLLPYFLVVSVMFREPSVEAMISTDRQDPSSTIRAFTYALIHNRMDAALPLASDGGQKVLQSWTTLHEPLSSDCHTPNDPDFNWTYMGSGSGQSDHVVSFFAYYECDSQLYAFEVAGATLSMSPQGWQVSGWTSICERPKPWQDEWCFDGGDVLPRSALKRLR